jgi:1,4-alpha-glucan branching enzyme
MSEKQAESLIQQTAAPGHDQKTAEPRSGMGAIPHSGGVTFRVWAPHANEVYVVGEFNNWSETANSLAHEENGYWSTDVPKAQVGQRYRYLLVNGDKRLCRMDPYAREATDSVGDSIITDPKLRLWRRPP